MKSVRIITKRVMILEILRKFDGDSVISEKNRNDKQAKTLIYELNFDKLSLRRKRRCKRYKRRTI